MLDARLARYGTGLRGSRLGFQAHFPFLLLNCRATLGMAQAWNLGVTRDGHVMSSNRVLRDMCLHMPTCRGVTRHDAEAFSVALHIRLVCHETHYEAEWVETRARRTSWRVMAKDCCLVTLVTEHRGGGWGT